MPVPRAMAFAAPVEHIRAGPSPELQQNADRTESTDSEITYLWKCNYRVAETRN